MGHWDAFNFYIDGKIVGRVLQGQCLFVDHPVGVCEVKSDADNPLFARSDHLTLHLEDGETRYVQVEMKSTFFVKVHLIISDPDQAVPDLGECLYVGTSLPAIAK